MESFRSCRTPGSRPWRQLDDSVGLLSKTTPCWKIFFCSCCAFLFTVSVWVWLLVSTLAATRDNAVRHPPMYPPILSPTHPPATPSSPRMPPTPPSIPLKPSQPPSPSAPNPPAPPDPYEPAGGCEWELNSWCRDLSLSHCGNSQSVSTLLARRGRGASGVGVAWRCYQPVCLTDGITPLHGCHDYCTRNAELSDILSRCHEGRYTMRRRQHQVEVRRYMIHLDRDGWKLGRFQNSVRDQGLEFHDLNINLRPGVIVSERPELMQWALDNNYMRPPSKPNNKGNIGSGFAHILLWNELSQMPDNVTYLIYEDNAIQTRRSEWAVDHFSMMDFEFFNLCPEIPRGSPTSEHGVLRFPNSEIIQPPPQILWSIYPMPNLWLSTYMITPSGAREMLLQMQRLLPDLSTLPIDQVAVMAMYRSSTARAYTVNSREYFQHISTHGDTRIQLNG